jgi:hypothetical protein
VPQNSDNQFALFIRDEKTGRRAFNTKALRALGIDPAAARERGYPLKDLLEICVSLRLVLALDGVECLMK